MSLSEQQLAEIRKRLASQRLQAEVAQTYATTLKPLHVWPALNDAGDLLAEIDRLRADSTNQVQTLQSFVDWLLDDEGLALAKYGADPSIGPYHLTQVVVDRQRLIAKFFDLDVDLDKSETKTEVAARAWAEGHAHNQRRDHSKSECTCFSRSKYDCGCGKYGTGLLLSLADNPYRVVIDDRDDD